MTGPVLKTDLCMHPITDSLNALPTWLDRPEELPSGIGELIGEAEAARQGVMKNVVGQLLNGHLHSIGCDLIGFSRNLDQRIVAKDLFTRSHQQSLAGVIVEIMEGM